CQNWCDDFAKIMHNEFKMSMMGEFFFLGLQMEDEIFFNQSKHIKEMLKKFRLEGSKPTKTPMSTEIKLTKDEKADSVDITKYRGELVLFYCVNTVITSFFVLLGYKNELVLLGIEGLVYYCQVLLTTAKVNLMLLLDSRPYIMFAVCACARFQVTPKVSHSHAVKRIFRYLKGQPKLGLWYPRNSPFDLVAYSDSDYAVGKLVGNHNNNEVVSS
ncbi:hypothetical protein Tco_0116797, partial [Tanacetum coccineum]